MKKCGFTLIEVLGTLVVLSLLALLITPVVSKTIKKNKERLYQVQIEKIEKAAGDYAIKNTDVLPEAGQTSEITLGEIKRAGFLPEEVRNPITKELFSDDLKIEISYGMNQYIYKVIVDDRS